MDAFLSLLLPQRLESTNLPNLLTTPPVTAIDVYGPTVRTHQLPARIVSASEKHGFHTLTHVHCGPDGGTGNLALTKGQERSPVRQHFDRHRLPIQMGKGDEGAGIQDPPRGNPGDPRRRARGFHAVSVWLARYRRESDRRLTSRQSH